MSPMSAEATVVRNYLDWMIDLPWFRKDKIEIDLTSQEIKFGNNKIKFDIEPFKKKCLLNGLDDISLSLEKSKEISSYEKKLEKNKPWIN